MTKILFFIILFSLVFSQDLLKTYNKKTFKIAFGSGNKRNLNDKSKIFFSVSRFKPDVWIWLGDSAHLDDKYFYGWYESNDLTEMKKRFISTKQDNGYRSLRNNTHKIIGTWGDHDYGKLNGDASYANKSVTKDIFLNFLDESKLSERRLHHDGVYASYYLGDKKKVKIILLDVKYNKVENDILGEKQWKWLETQLWKNNASITIFATSTQFLPDDRYFNSWDSESRDRFLKLLKKTGTKGPIIISGEANYGEVMSLPCSDKKLGFKLYEVTSSGLTNSLSDDIPFGQYFQTFFYPETYNTHQDRYSGKNFGTIEINWGDSLQDTLIQVEIKGDNGVTGVTKLIYMDSITPDQKRKKDSSEDYCKTDSTITERRINQILSRLKKYDFFLFFLIASPFLTYWTLKFCLKHFYNFLISLCTKNDDENEEKEDSKGKTKKKKKKEEKEEEEEEEEEGEDEEEEEEEEDEEEEEQVEGEEGEEVDMTEADFEVLEKEVDQLKKEILEEKEKDKKKEKKQKKQEIPIEKVEEKIQKRDVKEEKKETEKKKEKEKEKEKKEEKAKKEENHKKQEPKEQKKEEPRKGKNSNKKNK